MTVEHIKQLMDACYLAKRARDMLPPLPDGVQPSYIRYLDTIQKLQSQGRRVRVSDLSDALGLPRPGVTRTVKEMERKGYLHKCAVCGITDADDPDMEFRYCSKCNGYYCYCSDHINNHTHIQ